MQLEEQRQAAIMTYVNLMRIKAHETAENKELDYQIRVAKVVLQNFGIDYSELVLHLPINYPFCLPAFPSTALFSVNDATASPPSNALYKEILDFAKSVCNWKMAH